MGAKKNEVSQQLRRNEEKWSAPLMNAGWTVVPSIILEKQDALGLDPIDMNILMHLAQYWWFSDNPPHPSKTTIARCIGVNASTVRRRIAAMEANGFISRVPRYDSKHGGQTSNAYKFDGLIKAAEPFAKEAIAAREEHKAENAARRSRKKPRLVVDNTPAGKSGSTRKK